MNSYNLSRSFWNWAFDNPEKVSTNHAAIYFFAVEHCNRLGWKKKFGFPSQMTMDAIGIKKHSTYIRYFNDLVEWKFFELIQKSKNQYSANIISLIIAMPKKGEALDEAMVKHRDKQTESNGQSIGSIIKQYNKEQLNQLQKDIDVLLLNFKEEKTIYTKTDFLTDWNVLRLEHLKKPSFLNSLQRESEEHFKDLLKDYNQEKFKEALIGLFKQKKLPNGNTSMQSNPKHFLTHFESYLTAYHDKNTALYGEVKNEY